MARRRRKEPPGTAVRSALDTRKLAEALRMNGIDTRLWVSYGTVGTVNEDGEVDPTNWNAIWSGPEGLEVDVLLEPSRVPVTCHYYGVAGGRAATIQSPIRPGDLVLVVLPGGTADDMPVIVAVMHSAAHPVPIGGDRLPVWRNDSVFVWAEDVPVSIRTKGGARVDMGQDGKVVVTGSEVDAVSDAVRLGAAAAVEQLVLGTSYIGSENPMIVALGAWVVAVAAAIAATPPVPPPNKVAVAGATVTLNPLIAAFTSGQFLSDVSKTK